MEQYLLDMDSTAHMNKRQLRLHTQHQVCQNPRMDAEGFMKSPTLAY